MVINLGSLVYFKKSKICQADKWDYLKVITSKQNTEKLRKGVVIESQSKNIITKFIYNLNNGQFQKKCQQV